MNRRLFSSLAVTAALTIASIGSAQQTEAAAVYAFFVGNQFQAGTEVNVTVDSQFTGLNYTGTMELSGGTIVGVTLNGSPVPFNFGSGGAAGYVAPDSYITFDNGTVTGGYFKLQDANGESYEATVVAGATLGGNANTGWTLDGLTVNGFFSSSAFLDINDPRLQPGKSFSGEFTSLYIQLPVNAAAGTTGDGIVNLSVVVPNPAVAMGALPLLGIIGAGYVRRRRQA